MTWARFDPPPAKESDACQEKQKRFPCLLGGHRGWEGEGRKAVPVYTLHRVSHVTFDPADRLEPWAFYAMCCRTVGHVDDQGFQRKMRLVGREKEFAERTQRCSLCVWDEEE